MTPLKVNPTHGPLLAEMKSWDLAPGADFRFSEKTDPAQDDFRFVRWIDRPVDEIRTAR